MSKRKPRDRTDSPPSRGIAKAEAAPSSSPEGFTERKMAATIAGEVGCDVRTAARAMREGVDGIRQMLLREALRPHVERWRARNSERASA